MRFLLQKLKTIGFSEDTSKWFKSYLSERIFLVNIQNNFSGFGKISYGVPQGSILETLFVSNRLQAVRSTLLFYANDLCVLCQHKNVLQIEKLLKKDVENLCDCFIDDKLSIYFGDDKRNQFFLQVNGEQSISVN